MNEQLNRQATQIFSEAMAGRIPSEFGSAALGGLDKAESALIQINSASKEGLKAFENVAVTAYKTSKAIGEKVLNNSEINTRTAVEAARELANAKSIPEAVRIQTAFFQKQVAAIGTQTQELFQLSSQAIRHNIDTVNAAAREGLANFKVV